MRKNCCFPAEAIISPVAVILMRLAQFIRSDLASIPVSARSGVFSEEFSERSQILAESEGFKFFPEDSSEEMPFFFGNADLARCSHTDTACAVHAGGTGQFNEEA